MEYEGLRNRKTKVLKGPTVSEPQPIQTDATSGHSHSPTNQASLAPFRLLGLSYAPTPAPQYTSEQESNVSPEPIHQEDPVTSPSPTVSADGRTILLKLLFRIGTHIFSRVIAQSADDMLRGTLVDGIKAEHSLQLYQAIQTFQSSASPLVDRLHRLSSAVNTVPDNAFVGYGQGLKESLELVCSGAELISTLNSGDSALQKLQKAQHHLSQLIKNNLLCQWTTDSSTLRLIDQAGQLIDEIAPLLHSETSLEEVMNWAKSSEFLEGLLKEHYRSMVEVFDELGQLTSLLRTRQAAHPEASALSHAAWLFKILSESRIGPFVSTHLFTALEPVISKLLSISSTVSLLLSFPAQSPASFQIKWLLGHMSDAQVRTVLPWPLVALTERLTHVLGTNPDLCEVIGACPAQGDLRAQIPWLIRAFQHPQFKDLTHKQFHAQLFDTLNSWKSSAVGLHQHLKAFPGFQSPLPSIHWTAQLLNSPALAEIEAIMPAVLLNDLAGWVLPVRSTLQLTSQLAPYPTDAPWQERLVWGTQLLMQEQTTELLSFFLPPSISTRLVQPLGIIRQASTFPKDHSYTEQLRWSASLLGSPSGQAVLKQFAPGGFDEFFAQLSISDDMFNEAQMLRQTLSSDAPWQQKAWHVYALLMPALKQVLKRNPEWVLRGVGWATGGNKTSVGLTLTALRVYMTMPEGLDWFGQFKWITTCTFHELTNEYSFIASTLIANGVYTATFSRYVYQVFEIYKNWSSPERTEAQLVELVNILKRDLVMPEHLQPLLDVIPALPALLSTGKAFMALPATMPMGQQALKIVEHLAHTDSAALTRLYDAIENYAVGGISQGINQVLQAIPDPLTLLPGASAAPVEQKDTVTAPHNHRHSTHSARAEIGVGLGGLIASTIGGLWAYANWHQASSTAFSSVPTGEIEQEPALELETFASNQPPEQSQILQPKLSKLKPPTSPIPNKAKIVAGISLLGAVASGGLIAKGIYDLTAHKALTLDEVQVYTRADLYSGDREALLEDIDLFLELLGPGITAPIKLFNSNEPTSSTIPPASTQLRPIDPDLFFSPVLNYVPETENKHAIEKRSPNMQMAAAMKELGQIKNEKRRRAQIQREQQESAKRRAIEERRTEELRKQQKIRDSLALSIRRNERAQLESTISKTTLQNTSSDLLAQMKLAQSLRRNINDMQTDMRDLADIDPVWKLLESTKTRILDIRKKIAQIVNIAQAETFLSNADLYALGLLEEMRDYYPEDTVKLWDNFLPFNFITYYYKGPHGERHIAEARFMDFLNGKVWHKLDQEEASEPFRFSAAREATEVAEDMRAGYTNYIPKAWTKNKYLNSEASRLGSNGTQIPLHMSDPITIKYQKYSSPTAFTKTGPILELVVTLDTYLRGGRWVQLGLPPGRFSKEAVIWPAHYPEGLGERLYTLDSRKQYLKGEWAFHNLNIRLESLRTQEQLSFEDTIAKFSSSDLVRDAELLTQQSWETMMFDNHGTPIGFTRNDVLSSAINTVEQRIVSYDKDCENETLSPVLVNLYKSEIKKLYALLSVLHQKTEQSLELVSQDENKDAQFDTQRRDFVAEFWTDPQFATRLLAHNCLKNLSPDSPLTIKIEKNNVPSLFTMSLIRILCDEHTRHAPANSKVDVQWPEGLSNNDPLLQEMMDTSATYARMLKRGVDAESAFQRIKITTIEEELQQGLDRISQSKASAAKPVALIKLAETVTVRFHPTYPYIRRHKKNAIFDSTRIDNSHPPEDMEFTLLELMAKQPQMELIGMPWHNRLEVDISKKFNPDVIKDLIKIDWQKKIESNIEKMKSDTQLRCDWALVFGSLISTSLSAAEVETAKTLTVNNRLTPGVYLINTKDNKLQVHSVFSSWVWKFNSNEELIGALETPLKPTSATSLNASSATLSNMNATTEQQNDQFYTWLNAHQEKKYQSESLGGNWISTNPSSRADKIAEQVLSGLLTVMKSDADMRLKSSSELGTHKFFKILEDLAPVFGVLLMPLTGPMAFLAAVGMASVNFLELLVADTTEEFKSIATKAAINAAFEVGPNIAVAGVSKIPARQIAKEIGKKLNTVKAILPGAQKTVERVASSIKTPLEPFRQTPSGTVGNLTEGTNQYLTKLKAHSTIAEAVNNPNGQCEILMDVVSTQIQSVDIGMTKIRFRAVQIWNNAMEQMPTHHFAVIGSKGNQDFVFDLSAHQFANKGMPDLTGPLILEEAEWAQKISNATTRKLIKYKDFSTSSQAAREFNSLPGHSPLDFIDGGVLLSIPQWYKQVTGWNPSGIARVGNTKILNLNPVLEAAKANRLGSKGVCWDYAVGVLNEANMISREGGQRLTRGLINASNYKGLWGNGRIDNVIRGPRAIKTMDELLKVRQGEMLIFMEVDPNMPLKGARPIHAMTSTGDGIFTGNKSTVLDSSLGDGKVILPAEHLGTFEGGQFTRAKGLPNSPKVEILAGFPMGVKSPFAPSLTQAAHSVIHKASMTQLNSGHIDFAATVLETSGSLGNRQALAFRKIAQKVHAPQANSESMSIDELLKDLKPITSLDTLKTVKTGEILVATRDNAPIKNIMVSLGNGKYAASELAKLDPKLPKTNGIVTAETLYASMSNGKIGGFDLKSGSVNLTSKSMRVHTILGDHSRYTILDSSLKFITTSPSSNLNFMDAGELFHTAKVVTEHNPGLGTLDLIKLQTHFAGLGDPAVAQTLSNLLQKPVKVPGYRDHSWRPSVKIYSPQPAFTMTDEAQAAILAQQSRTRALWNRLLNQYSNLNSRLATASFRTRRSIGSASNDSSDSTVAAPSSTPFEDLIKNAGDLIMAKPEFDVDMFIAREDSYPADAKTALQELVDKGIPDNASEFASRMIQVLSLTKDSLALMNDFVSTAKPLT